MFDCENLSVSLGEKRLLQNVSFHLKKGSFTAILGRNGSGKSTLAACVRQELPYTGHLRLGQTDLASQKPKDLAQQIASLPQILPCPCISVRELVGFGRSPYLGLNRQFSPQDRQAVDAALTRTGMTDFSQRMLSTLSGGERQRAFLAMILAQQTEMLVLDEPTAYMDMDAEAAFVRLLAELAQEGKTLLVILHNLSLAIQYADALIVLDAGSCVYAGEKSQCLKTRILESVFHVTRLDTGREILFMPNPQ